MNELLLADLTVRASYEQGRLEAARHKLSDWGMATPGSPPPDALAATLAAAPVDLRPHSAADVERRRRWLTWPIEAADDCADRPDFWGCFAAHLRTAETDGVTDFQLPKNSVDDFVRIALAVEQAQVSTCLKAGACASHAAGQTDEAERPALVESLKQRGGASAVLAELLSIHADEGVNPPGVDSRLACQVSEHPELAVQALAQQSAE